MPYQEWEFIDRDGNSLGTVTSYVLGIQLYQNAVMFNYFENGKFIATKEIV